MTDRQKFFIGSEGDNGEHMRDLSGWPYSIYFKDDRVGRCDAVLCHGIQSLSDAEILLALCNGAEKPAPHHNALFAWA